MKRTLLFSLGMIMVSFLIGLNTFGQSPAIPDAASPFFDDGGLLSAPPAMQNNTSNRSAGLYDALVDGADRLDAMQNPDGGWGWPLSGTSALNTIGPIGMGLGQAYPYTLDADHLAALSATGNLLLTKTNNFSPSDGYLAAKLDEILGVSTYTTHLTTNFYGPLAAGTYNRNGAGTLYTTAMYVDLIRTSRASQGIPNLAAWDVGMGLVGAASCGVTGTELDYWIAGVEGEIEELDIYADYDVVGLAGALYALAFVDEEFDPTAGPHMAASDLEDLADILVNYQITLGGFAWNSQYVIPNDFNETIQETAYSILALNEVNRNNYLDNIYGAADYMIGVQLGTGGWENYVGSTTGENNEVTAEALWGLAKAYPPVHNVTQDLYYGTIQAAIDGAVAGDLIQVMPGVYTEQLHITTNNLTIEGAGKSSTIIKSPSVLALFFTSSPGTDNKPIVFVDGVSSFTMSDLTVDGDGKGDVNYRFQGIGFWNSGGTIENVDVLRVKDTPFSGSQHGVGVYSYNDTGGPYTISLSDMLIDDYQKGGIALSGTGLTVDLDNITTVGEGPTTVTAQNGIQISYGAGGIISNCNVSDNLYIGSWASTGFLLYQATTVNMQNITATDNSPGVDANDCNGSLNGGVISNTDPDSWDGIYVRKYTDAKGPDGGKPIPEASPIVEEYSVDPASRAATSFSISNVTLTSDGKADSWGVLFRSNTGTLNASLTSSLIDGWDYGVVIREKGTGLVNSEIHNCNLANNNWGVNYLYSAAKGAGDQDATDNWWGDPSGPYDPAGNPTGQGSQVSNMVNYADWITDPVDIHISNPSCGILEVTCVPSMPLNGSVTNILFAVSWDWTKYPDSFFDVYSDYDVDLQYYYNDGTTGYAVFGTDLTTIDWDGLVGDVILTIELKQNQPEGTICDFLIADDAWTAANNADYYFEFWGSDLTGVITGFADDVYLGSCDLELHAKVFLQGPYNTTTNLMNPDLNTNLLLPLEQPFGSAPWNYDGEEELLSIPTGMVDWVLVELRATPTGTPIRKAGLLFNDGTIRSHIDSFFDIYFEGDFMPNSDYYVAVFARNHMPVMSAAAVNIPNAGSVCDFSNIANAYGGATAEILLEAGVHGMIAGDINGDGDLIYSGFDNDRGLILQRIISETGNTYINGVTQGYLPEDLTMNSWVKYSGSGNDQRLIILNLIELTGTYNLNETYASLVPGWGAKAPHMAPGNGPLDIALVENNNSLDAVLITKENLGETWIDNIQFTLSWDVNNVMMDQVVYNYTSDFGLEPQGGIVTYEGRKYLTFVVIDWLALPVPFEAGDQVTLLSLQKGSYSGMASKTAIAQDGYTLTNNGGYYISLIGQDMTGQVLDAMTGIDDPVTAGSSLSIYPNPVTNGQLTLTVIPAAEELLTISITDVSSRTVYQETIQVTSGARTVKAISTKNLTAGAYLVKVTGNETFKTGKIIVR